VEGAFRTNFCPVETRVRFAVNLLRGAAKDWWKLVSRKLTEAEVTGMTWYEFLTRFRDEHVPQIEGERLTRELLALKQTSESVIEITEVFMEKVRFCPDYLSERLQMTHYSDMSRSDIREWVMVSRP